MSGARPRPTFADGRPQSVTAIAYAKRKHAGQQRPDGTPFVQHPLEVASSDDERIPGWAHRKAALRRQRLPDSPLVGELRDELHLFMASAMSIGV